MLKQSSAWDHFRSVITHCGGAMQATLDIFQIKMQSQVISPLVFPKLPSPTQHNVSPMLPPHVTSNFQEKRFQC